VNFIEANPNDPKNQGYQEVWDDVVDKLGDKFSYGAGVAYWRNKAKKVLGGIPEQLDKKPKPSVAPTAPRPRVTPTKTAPTPPPKKTRKPKAPVAPPVEDWKDIPKEDDTIEDWGKQNAQSKSLVEKYVKQRSELETQLADIQTKLKALKPLEEKLLPIVKAMKEGSVSVGDSVLKYKQSKRATVAYEKAFQMALTKVAEAEREFTKGWILGQLTSDKVTEKLELKPKGSLVKALHDKGAGVWNYINNQVEKLSDLASNYRRAVVQLDKVVS
jgi:chaperonin cofactor prefoldin